MPAVTDRIEPEVELENACTRCEEREANGSDEYCQTCREVLADRAYDAHKERE